MQQNQLFNTLKPNDVFYIDRSYELWQKDSFYSRQAINFFDHENIILLSPEEQVTCVWSNPIQPGTPMKESIFFWEGPIRTGPQARKEGMTSEVRLWIDDAMRAAVKTLRGMNIPEECVRRQLNFFEENIGNAESWNDQMVLDDGQMLWLIIREKLKKDAPAFEDRIFQYQVEVVARFSIRPDRAALFRSGTVVKDNKGTEYLALGARHDWLEVAPFVNGKPQVISDTCFKFLLVPERSEAYPERRADPVFLTGRNYYEEQRLIQEQRLM